VSKVEVAVVTGASGGIGREFCEQLAARGYDLLVVARDRSRLEALAADLGARRGVQVEVLAADLSRDSDIGRVAARLATEPRLALLVNNAGFGTRGHLADADPERQVAMLMLHVVAPMRLSQAVLPSLLRHRSGAIVNVSSLAGFIHSPGKTNYCATKAYLTTFSEGLAAEVAGSGVRVQALCPGFTRSEFHHRMQVDPGSRDGFRWMSAESVVRASLRSLARGGGGGGPVICVPGLANKVLVGLIRLTPRRVVGWLARVRARGRAV